VLLLQPAPGVAVLALNRPKKRNAITGAMAAALEWAALWCEASPEVRVMILTSAAPGMFCAGADLGEVSQGRERTIFTPQGGFGGLVDLPHAKPWVAAVSGPTLAGGLELVLACDMIIAAPSTTLGLPEVKRGLFAAAGGVHRLPRALPRHVALELVCTGEPMPVARAHALGLVNHVAPEGEVLERAVALGRIIAANAPGSVRESLALARASSETPDADMRTLSAAASARVHSHPDSKEGPRAFLEKRPPVWSPQPWPTGVGHPKLRSAL
jgi:enoyl-CoA hydratase